MALLPSNFDNPSCSRLIENKQSNENNIGQKRMNNELVSAVAINNIFNGSSASLPIVQDIEGKKISLTSIREKVKKLNSAELMLLFMHLPTYACSDGSVELNFRLERNTLIKNSLVSLVSDSMKGTINTISEEIRGLTEDVDIIEKKLFNNVGVVRNNAFGNLNFNKSVQTVIAWCKVNYKQKLDSVVIKSDLYNHYSNVCTSKSTPLMSTLLFGKLVLIIFPSAAVTKNSKGILQYKNLSKLEHVVALSEVNMDSIAAQFSCKQIYDIYDQIINHISKKVAKTHMDNRQESQRNNITFALNNDNENDSYRSGELNGRTVLVHDPLSLLNLSAAVNNESRKKSNNLKSKSTNNDPDPDILTTQKLADIIGSRLEVDSRKDIFQKNLNLFKSKGLKFKEYKHPSVKKIATEYPKISLSTDLMQLNITPNLAISEKEIFTWYIKRFTTLEDKLSKMTSTQIPGKGMHKLHCGCCNVNFEVGEGYVRGLDLLRNKLSKLKIVDGVVTTIYIERDENDIIEIEDEDTIEETTETVTPHVNNRVPVIINTQSLAIPSPPSNVQVLSPSSSKEILPSRSPSPVAVPQIITKPTPSPLQVVTKPTIHSQIFTKPTVTLPQIVTEPPVTLPQIVTEPPVTLPQIVTELPVALPQSVPLVTFSQIVTKLFESPQITSKIVLSPEIMTKSPEVSPPQVEDIELPIAALPEISIESPVELPRILIKSPMESPQISSISPLTSPQILSNSLTIIPPLINNSITVTSKIIAKPATVSSQISTKPTIISSKVIGKVRRKPSLQLKKNIIITSVMKDPVITTPAISKPSTQANASSPPVEKISPPNSNNKPMPKMILLSELLENKEPPISNIHLPNLNVHKTSANKSKSSIKHVNNSNIFKSVKIRKELENISPPMSIITARVPSNTSQHISVQSLYQKYNKIIIPKTVIHSDVAPVVVLNSGEVCDWYQEQMDNLKRQVRKYKKRRHKASCSSTATKEKTSTSLVSENAISNNFLSFRRSKARLMNFCESESDGESKVARNSEQGGATLSDLLNKPVNSYVSQVTLKRARMETLDEHGNKKRKIFREHIKGVSIEETLDENLIEISDDIQTTVVDNNKVYNCIFCLKPFNSRDQLLYHLRIHMHCKTCKKRFKSVDLMLKHLKGHCVNNERWNSPCLKIARVDAGIAEAKNARKNSTTVSKISITVPKNKEIANSSATKSNNRPKLMNNAIKLKELLNNQYSSRIRRSTPSMMPPPKLVPTSNRTSQPISVSLNSPLIQQSGSTNTSHGSVFFSSIIPNPQSLPSLSMPLLNPPPLVTTSMASKPHQISKPPPPYTANNSNQFHLQSALQQHLQNAQPVQLKNSTNNNLNQIQLQPAMQQHQQNAQPVQLKNSTNNSNQFHLQPAMQQQNAQPGQLKNSINNNFGKIFLLNSGQGGSYNMCGGQVVINNNENAYLVTSGNQSYISNPISAPYSVPPSFNILSTVTAPTVQQLNLQPNGLEDHSYHQQRFPLQEENVDVNKNNSTLQPSSNIPDGGGFKLRVKSLQELR